MQQAVERGTLEDPVVVAGLAVFGAVVAPIPARSAACLAPSAERAAQRAAESIAAGWNLLSLSPAGSALVGVLDAAGARIEVGGAPQLVRAGRAQEGAGCSPAGVPCAPCSGRLGRRSRAMGTVVGPGGRTIQLSCRAVVGLPVGVVGDPSAVAHALAHHAAWHVLDLLTMPSAPAIVEALAEVARRIGLPADAADGPRWASGARRAAIGELGFAALEEGLCAFPNRSYSDH